jgi:tRNA (mo5U34)-methyltransferase
MITSARKAWETFDLCQQAFGFDQEKCRREEISIYDVSEARHGRFDVVFCFGVIYHLRYPLLALDRLAATCNEEIFIKSAILDDFSPYRGGVGKGYASNDVVMEFYPGNEYGNNNSNWWCPTLRCLASLVSAAGFSNMRTWKLTENPQRIPDSQHQRCRDYIGIKAGRT